MDLSIVFHRPAFCLVVIFCNGLQLLKMEVYLMRCEGIKTHIKLLLGIILV